jgi:hypothetical protein
MAAGSPCMKGTRTAESEHYSRAKQRNGSGSEVPDSTVRVSPPEEKHTPNHSEVETRQFPQTLHGLEPAALSASILFREPASAAFISILMHAFHLCRLVSPCNDSAQIRRRERPYWNLRLLSVTTNTWLRTYDIYMWTSAGGELTARGARRGCSSKDEQSRSRVKVGPSD